MQTSSGGITVCRKETSDINHFPLEDEATLNAFNILRLMFSSCLGPRGRCKLIHNNSGGHVMVTSSSLRLLSNLSVSRPLIRLMTTALRQHVDSYSDGGLTAGLLALELVDLSLKSHVHRRLIVDIHEVILQKCLEYLNQDGCLCKITIDFTRVQDLITIAGSVISSKPACLLSDQDVRIIATLLVKIFLKSCDDSYLTVQENVHFLCLEGKAPSESHVMAGLLFEVPQIPAYRGRQFSMTRLENGLIKTALFNISLAGDHETGLDAEFEVTAEASMSDVILSDMIQYGEKLCEQQVGVILCQKVIHPMLKKYLREQGVLVLDRLGAVCIKKAQTLTGGSLLGSFLLEPEEREFGFLSNVTHNVLEGKSYLLLQGKHDVITTLVLCHRTEQSLEELKIGCQVTVHILTMLLREPAALTGRGCWQCHLAAYIRKQVSKEAAAWCVNLDCDVFDFSTVAETMATCLEKMALAVTKQPAAELIVDSRYHHLWLARQLNTKCSPENEHCQCGLVTRQPEMTYSYLLQERQDVRMENVREVTAVGSEFSGHCDILDSFIPYINALRLGITIADMILGIDVCIVDKN